MGYARLPSAQGAKISASIHLPLAASSLNKVPVVLMTHGGGGNQGQINTNSDMKPVFDGLIEHGYAVVTWDTRGHGASVSSAADGGLFGPVRYHVADESLEVQDVSVLMDFAATCDEIQLDGPGDPRAGWTGASNGGGIELVTAAFERRIDAIAPYEFWGRLDNDFFPNGVPKEWWRFLYERGYGYGEGFTPDTAVADDIHRTNCEITGQVTNGISCTPTGRPSADSLAWFAARSTPNYAGRITVPTMLVQGTPNTGHPLGDALDVYAELKSRTEPAAPVKMVAACMGHSGCPYSTPAGVSATRWQDLILAWLDRHVKGLPIDTGPAIEWQAQDGYYRVADAWPLAGTTPVLQVTDLPASCQGCDRTEITWPSTGGGTGADTQYAGRPVDVRGEEYAKGWVMRPTVFQHPSNSGTCLPIFGTPSVTLHGSVTGNEAWLFIELMESTGYTLDGQVQAVTLPPGPFQKTLPLNAVAWVVKPGRQLGLEISTGSGHYQDPPDRPAYSVEIRRIELHLPISQPLAATADLVGGGYTCEHP